MELSFIDRVHLLGILPAEGDLTTIKIVRDLKGELSFSEQEYKDFKIATQGNQITWDNEAAKDKEVAIGPKAHLIISDALQALEQQKRLKLEWLPLYEKFVEHK